MADSTVSDLETMKETPVSGLPGAIEIYDNALFLLEHNGVAYHVTGAQLKSYAVAAAQNVNKGADGITPHIGNNGNWFIGDVDTGVKAAGTNGQTPYIGTNNHWWIGETDTGVVAVGQDGNDGKTPYIGYNGHWFVGDTDTGVAAQGPSGSGTGDMLAEVYDPQGKAEDIFGYVDGALRYAFDGADNTPTEGSSNIVTSGGVFTALEDKQDKITGAEGQVVGFDADGNAVAQDLSTSASGSSEWRLVGSNTNCQDAYITNDPDDTFTLELDEEVDFSSISEFILIVGAANWTGTVPSTWSASIVDQDGNSLPGVIVLGSDSTVQYRTWVHAIKCGEKWMNKVDSWETTGSAAKFTAGYAATSATTVTAIKFVASSPYEAKISNYSFVRLFVR